MTKAVFSLVLKMKSSMFLKLKKSFAKAWSRTNLTFVLVFKFWVSQVDLSEKFLLRRHLEKTCLHATWRKQNPDHKNYL